MYPNKERKKTNKQFLVDPGTQEKTWCAKCNKTIRALHFVHYDAL